MQRRISNKMVVVLGVLVFWSACSKPTEVLYKKYHEQVSSVGDINDEMVRKYIKTYRNLRKFGISFEQYLADNPEASTKAYTDMEKIIKEGGFKDFPEFVKVNAKIAWAWNMAQARIGMRKQEGLQKWAHKELDSGMQMIVDNLNDPNVPEETKVELRKTLAELQSGKEELAETYTKNLKWANWAMKFTLPLTNEKDIEVILRHESELMEVFTGLSKEQLDQINDHTMKHLGIE